MGQYHTWKGALLALQEHWLTSLKMPRQFLDMHRDCQPALPAVLLLCSAMP